MAELGNAFILVSEKLPGRVMETQLSYSNTEDSGKNQSAMAESYGNQMVCSGTRRNSREHVIQISHHILDKGKWQTIGEIEISVRL